ncbi:ZIP family metal transporter [Candidatus Peregrinibacteria bacterium]|nr:ZIP family metal transporter [Candidatus Peregrinibacteria bacterium]
MAQIWIYTMGSVTLISLMSLIGLITFPLKAEKLKHFMISMISLSAGALLGDAFLHLLPELIEEGDFTSTAGLYIISGIAFSFIIEKIIHWRHCHHPTTSAHPHPFAWMNLFGDGIHNFIDGLIIGAAFLVSIPVGIATALAVILHEIPQEIGDFGVLLAGGFSRSKALLLNLATALASVLGAVIALLIGQASEHLTAFIIPFAIGGFIYIAAADLIPELHKETKISKSLTQFVWFLLGVGSMYALLYTEQLFT